MSDTYGQANAGVTEELQGIAKEFKQRGDLLLRSEAEIDRLAGNVRDWMRRAIRAERVVFEQAGAQCGSKMLRDFVELERDALRKKVGELQEQLTVAHMHAGAQVIKLEALRTGQYADRDAHAEEVQRLTTERDGWQREAEREHARRQAVSAEPGSTPESRARDTVTPKVRQVHILGGISPSPEAIECSCPNIHWNERLSAWFRDCGARVPDIAADAWGNAYIELSKAGHSFRYWNKVGPRPADSPTRVYSRGWHPSSAHLGASDRGSCTAQVTATFAGSTLPWTSCGVCGTRVRP